MRNMPYSGKKCILQKLSLGGINQDIDDMCVWVSEMSKTMAEMLLEEGGCQDFIVLQFLRNLVCVLC